MVLRDSWRQVSGDVDAMRADGEGADPELDVERITFAAKETISPLVRLELALHPWDAERAGNPARRHRAHDVGQDRRDTQHRCRGAARPL
jgi:hypothetical protein